MAETFGKRKRRDVAARKAAAYEERRVARAARKKDRQAGLIEPGSPIERAEQSEWPPAGDGSGGPDDDRNAGA
ncbi:MAG: hypothetical protein AB1551_06120 [Actinomycetota bacterium]